MIKSVVRNECMFMLAGSEVILLTKYFKKYLEENCVERTTKNSLLNHLQKFGGCVKKLYKEERPRGTIVDEGVISDYTDNLLLTMKLVGWLSFYNGVQKLINNLDSNRVTLSKFIKSLDKLSVDYFDEAMDNACMERDKRIEITSH